MRQKTERHQGAAERTIRDIRRRTRKRYSSEGHCQRKIPNTRGGHGTPWFNPEKYREINGGEIRSRCAGKVFNFTLTMPSDGLVIGKRYLIESWRKQKRRKECELTIKKLTADDEGKLWFVTESSHPAYQMSIPFSDTSDVAIKPVAQVVGSMQLE
jgi:hypothetical protein